MVSYIVYDANIQLNFYIASDISKKCKKIQLTDTVDMVTIYG